MRALVDIPDRQISDLAMICEAENKPRAEIIRQAIAAYIAEHRPNVSAAFGLWKSHSKDGLVFQEEMRSEW
jgi:metal-responsive CopG/Arc/MetJ family transcriptional regulator